MNIDSLNEGDILVFEAAPNSPISKLIAKLTDSDVSHAAMYYNSSKHLIVEQTKPHVSTRSVANGFGDRKVYVRRLQGKLSLSPVIAAAKKSLDREDPYDWNGLILIAILLIYKRKHHPSERTLSLLRLATKKLRKQMNKDQIRKGKKPSVCSQFVAQCYEEAGSKAYKLRVVGGTLSAETQTGSLRASSGQGLEKDLVQRALERLEKRPEISRTFSAFPESDEVADDATIDASIEQACSAILAELEPPDPNQAETDTQVQPNQATLQHESQERLEEDFLDAVEEFALAYELLGSTEADQTPKNVDLRRTALQGLATLGSGFVTPADLKDHTTNLDKLGEIRPT